MCCCGKREWVIDREVDHSDLIQAQSGDKKDAALLWATYHDGVEAVRKALDAGADVNCKAMVRRRVSSVAALQR